MHNTRQLKGHDSPESHEYPMRLPQSQALNMRTYPELTTIPASGTDDFSAVMEYFWILMKRKWALTLAVVLGALLSLGLTLWMIPLYRARTSIEIQNVQEPFGSAIVMADPTLMTQTQLLLSATMRDRDSTLKLTSQEPSFRSVGGGWRNVFLRGLLWLSDPAQNTSWAAAVGWAAGKLRVTSVKDSRVLVIQTESPNPEAAAEYVNTLAQDTLAATRNGVWSPIRTPAPF